MQLLIRTETNAIENLISFIKSLTLEFSQIECVETIGHFNIFVWIISENPIDLHLIKDKIQIQKGVREIRANILQDVKDFYTKINLDHLEGKEAHG